eukprot:CAMPEP_0180143858 /NCGR_PEP_ID=MMETSP0986-20121125/16531_1 /TAXON_ID=697907 /ORGANISM="non described non described, Strain CCMP2293" /LENGTH=266 /DNA_ID=CAMNT_0022087537 /DNA_START=40 /DNA_END=840 /DNA_ORIENTATION=-
MANFHASSSRHFTVEEEAGDDSGTLRKRKFRSRAHANPLADPQFEYPVDPASVDWTACYPALCDAATGVLPKPVDFADVGCGFGGLLIKLGEHFPEEISVGIEIREKVSSYVDARIKALRTENAGKYNNIGVVRTNAMKCITNFFPKESLSKLFFCFADPHFKTKNHRRRIINRNSLAEFAYILKPGAKLYVVTDVKELHDWQMENLDNHPSFERVPKEEEEADISFKLIFVESEEACKVARNEGSKFGGVYRRLTREQVIAKQGA